MIELNTRPEKSECVPSCEKWSCHQVASWVLRIDTATPTGSESTAKRPTLWAIAAGSASAGSGAGASGSAVAEASAPGRAVLETAVDAAAATSPTVVLTAPATAAAGGKVGTA